MVAELVVYFLLALGVDDQVLVKNIRTLNADFQNMQVLFTCEVSIQKLSKYLVMCLNKFGTRPHTQKKNEDIWKNTCTTGKYDKYGRISFEIKNSSITTRNRQEISATQMSWKDL